MTRRLLLAGTLLLAVVGCGVGVPPPDVEPTRTTGEITVSVPGSMTEAITAVASQYETEHPGVAIRVSTVGIGDATKSAPAGAPDVTVAELVAMAESQPSQFATAQFVVAVAPDNPKRLGRLADLTRSGLRVALCTGPQACGVATDAMLAEAKVKLPKAVRVADSRAALAKVQDGSVDAAIVLRTDARTAGDAVNEVEVMEASNHRVAFSATTEANAQRPEVAADFVTFLSTATAQDRLASYGFQLGR